MIFCLVCGASAQSRVRTGHGLAEPCKGAEWAGLAVQRSRLRRGLHPQPVRGASRIGPAVPLNLADRLHWASKLGILPPTAAEAEPAIWYGLKQSRLQASQVFQAFGFGSFTGAVDFGKAVKRDLRDDRRRWELEALGVARAGDRM